MNKSIVIFIATIMLFSGCATFKQLTSTKPFPECNEAINPTSLLLNIANHHKVCLEDVGNTLIIANAIAINQGVYTKEQAKGVIRTWLNILKSEPSYAMFRKAVYDEVNKFPGLFEIMDIYLIEFENVNVTILKSDRELLIDWLTNRVMSILNGV